ncbi:MAG: AAA family ATPase [Candidatus Lokiarchaeota archaeon]|nr:AAA family ATPase [Candidatus Lokiarchaeota archaeon]
MAKHKYISFISAPGGVGKTTTILCLSWLLRENNKSILLIDMDPSLGLTLHLYNDNNKILRYKREIENHNRTSADLLNFINERRSIENHTLESIINRIHFKGIKFDFIPGSIRLEDVMGRIWHSTSGGHREKYLRRALDKIQDYRSYDYILIDNIPCYAFMYSITALFASNICIMPLRLTITDLYRTLEMITRLRDTLLQYELTEKEFFSKIHFLFSIVKHYQEKKVKKYKHVLKNTFANAHIFNNFINKSVSFTRIGTDEEKSTDARKVRENFESFFNEFNQKIAL